MLLRLEATRILLKHPYQRRKENPELAYLASNITLQEYLRTTLPLPRARDIFDDEAFDLQYFEFYYYKLLEQQDQNQSNDGIGSSIVGSGMSSSSGTPDDEDSEQPGNTSDEGDDQDDSQDGNQDCEPDSEPEDGQSKSDELLNDSEPEPESSPEPSLESYADHQQSGRENTQDWDSDELQIESINDHIRTASENNTWGTVTGNLRERVMASLRPKLDYRAVLRQFRTTILSTNRSLTRMKPSRRYGFLYMGSRRDFTTNLLFAVDVSGSVSSQDLARGFSVVNRFFKYGVQSIDVIQFDTEIKGKPVTLRKARKSIRVLGRGGTNFQDVVSYVDEHPRYDIFTDGYAPAPVKPKNQRTRILWLFNHESNYERTYQQLRHIGRAAFLKED